MVALSARAAAVIVALRKVEPAVAFAVLSTGLTLMIGVATLFRLHPSALPLALPFVVVLSISLGTTFLVRGWLAAPAALAAIALVTIVSLWAFHAAPTVVWLFGFIVPAVGLVHGPRLGAFAGAISAPALHLIETGAGIDLLDPQTPFGVLILVALGATPGYLLALARSRREELNVQLDRAEGLVHETDRARQAEKAAHHQAIFMLARAAEARDGTTGIHIEHVRDYAQKLARAVGLPEGEVDEISWSAMLHDVGKLRVPDGVLLKPGALDENEWQLIRQHPAWGEELLKAEQGFGLARQVARWHHENWDGSGYPDGLRESAIPLAARIVRVVDVFDALVSVRPYKPAWKEERALEEILAMRGRGLDPELADLFVAVYNGKR